MSADPLLYFRQLLAGRDFATADPVAGQMANFVYAVGDRQARKCLLVDPAWHVGDLLELVRQDDMQVAGILCTHYHPDHVGGEIFGHRIEGVAELLELVDVPVYANKHEVDGLRSYTGCDRLTVAAREGGDRLQIGAIDIELIHTPGHTPGSQCFLVDGKLVSGDTLFIEGCGRVDLPGGDADEMYRTLTQRFSRLADDVILYPGHNYAAKPTSTLGDERQNNTYLRIESLDAWRRLWGHAAGS